MRYHLTLVRIAINKKVKIIIITSIGKDVKKREFLDTNGENISWYIHYGKQYGGSSKK